MNHWRLGIDLGSNSLGWAAVSLDADNEPDGLMAWGVRIFPDGRNPQNGESLAVARRIARGMRRNRDRRQSRVRAFARLLADYGLGVDVATSPYKARSDAASGRVAPSVLGRALLHLCRRRGFLSNRKTDTADKDASERKRQMNILQSYLDQNGITLGQFLHEREQAGLPLRFRASHPVTVEVDGTVHPVYPTRAMYLDEFATIRRAQADSLLTDAQWETLESALAFQRPLRPQAPGRCTFEDAPRASNHLPLAQTFRIVQEVNNLRYYKDGTSHDLTPEQRITLYELLESHQAVKFSSMRTRLKLGKESRFNLESERRQDLKGNATAALMRKRCSAHDIDWDAFPDATQDAIVQCMLDADTLQPFIEANATHGWNLPPALLETLHDTPLSSSFARLSATAMRKLLPLMREGLQYWDAATRVYGGHTDDRFATGEVLERLPYYGAIVNDATTPVRQSPSASADELEYGRIPNPTVHVALNQLRRVVNALLTRFGNPHQIHIELARELKNSPKRCAEIEKEIAKATAEREANVALLQSCGLPGHSPDDLIKIRLWKELAEAPTSDGPGGMCRVDIYTGKTISLAQCVSDEVEVEHILPFSRTYDNTMANKTVTFRYVNREKGDLTPAEYLMRKGGSAYEDALQRADKQLRAAKRWRFQTDAMDIFERAILRKLTGEEKAEYFENGADGAFIARQLKDTQYMARVAARYLVPVVGAKQRVLPVNGGMTALLRGKWRLDFAKRKGTDEERADHRHHAVDALVVALTSRSMVQRIGRATTEAQQRSGDYRAKVDVPMPAWLAEARNGELSQKYDAIAVSFKQDHTREGKLFEGTAYGLLSPADPARKQGYNAVTRRTLAKLKEKEVAQIRDTRLREAIVEALHSPAYAGLKWEAKLGKLAQEGVKIGHHIQHIRRVRILVTDQSIRPVPSAPYKGYSPESRAFCDVWKVPNVNKKGTFTGTFSYQATYISYADAKTYEGDDVALFRMHKPHPAAKHCMRLFKHDMVLLHYDGRPHLMRVAGFSSTNNRIDLRVHTETNGKQSYYSVNKAMSEQNMRKVQITPDGRVLLS